MPVNGESVTLQQFARLSRQQRIHENSAAEDNTIEACLLTNAIADTANHARDGVMKASRDHRRLDASLHVCHGGANQRSRIDHERHGKIFDVELVASIFLNI